MSISDSLSGAEKYVKTLRDKSVVLDADLAHLFGLTVLYLNRETAKKSPRFPEDFYIELSDAEKSAFKIAPDRRAFAYTEEGIAMLSIVLKTPKAEQTSVALVRSAVEARRFIAKHKSMLETVAETELQFITRKKLAKIIEYIETQDCENSQQKIFFSGQIYDAYSFFADLIKQAKTSIIVVDGYANVNTLDLLRNRKKGVKTHLLTLPSTKLSANELSRFQKEYPGLTLYKTSDFHDRFLILDEQKFFHIGASLKDVGTKSFAVTRLEEQKECQKLLSRIKAIMV